MSDPKCAKVLLDAAERDILTLRYMGGGVPPESYGFHIQQAAEKSLKAWLAVLGVTYPLTHNLKTLLDLLATQGARTEPYRDLMEFTPFAIEFRYESVDLDIEPIDRTGVLGLLDALHDQVQNLLTLIDEA